MGVCVVVMGCGDQTVVLPATPATVDMRPDATGDMAKDMTIDAPADLPTPRDMPINQDASTDQTGPMDMSNTPRTYTVAVVSDLNGSYGSTTYGQDVHRAVNWLSTQLKPDLVLSTGDMVAGQKQGLNYKGMWQGFHDAVTLPLKQAGIPFAPTPGNHDASGYDAFEHERNEYIEQWQKHSPQVEFVERTYYPLYYAYKVGPALFISLDDTLIGKLGGPQLGWLEDVLKNNADVPLKFVYGHIPLYAVAQGRESQTLRDDDLERLLDTYQVTAFISGHHHAYYPGKRGSLRLVNLGCLGSGARRLIGESSRSDKSLVVFQYNAQGMLDLDGLKGAQFQEVIPRSTLPPKITYGGRTIVRDDL